MRLGGSAHDALPLNCLHILEFAEVLDLSRGTMDCLDELRERRDNWREREP